MSEFFNDSPIEKIEDDEYGVAAFAEAMARSILEIKRPVGTTIALNGAWGSGKSSAVNLIRAALTRENDERLVVTEFKCWWYRGEEALALAFLQNLNAVLSGTLQDKVKDLVPKMGRGLLQAGPIIGSAVALTPAGPFAGFVGGAFDFAKRYFPEGDTVESTFQKLSEVLEKENRRFLVIIDDIDRLEAEEALAIFRLIKSVGRLPNVIYLVVFDRDIAEAAVAKHHPSEGPHFLEKIIQAGFELPSPLSTDLQMAVLSCIDDICGSPADDQVVRFMNVFYDVVAPYVITPRHVTRLRNAVTVTWPAIGRDVDLADFIALETIRLYEPSLFAAIRGNKDLVCGSSDRAERQQQDVNRFAPFLRNVPEERRDLAKTALQRIFPRLEQMGIGRDWEERWQAERRVCHESHFDTYFRLSLSEEVLSVAQLEEIIQRAADEDFVRNMMLTAANKRRRVGRSFVPSYLDELNANAKRIPKAKVEPLLRALFKVHDAVDLDQDADKGMMSFADTSMRYHWLIRRLTRGRFTLDERTVMYTAALQGASLGWLVDFVASAREDYRQEGEGSRTREEDRLVREDSLQDLTSYALVRIRESAANDTLLQQRHLLHILYRWLDFLEGDPSEIRTVTDRWLLDRSAVTTLARSLTGSSWSMGMGGFGGLGDRVAKMTTTVRITDDMKLIDIPAFRSAVEQVRDASETPEQDRVAVVKFLEAWDRRAKGADD